MERAEELDIHDVNEKIIFDNIYEYEENSIREEDQKNKSFLLRLIVLICALLIISLLLSISNSLKNFFPPLGYISLFFFAIFFILYFVRPVMLFFKMDYFEVNSKKDAQIIKTHNNKVRRNVAKKIVDFQNSVRNAGWYDKDYVEKLDEALKQKNDNLIHKYLTILMNDSIKKASDKIIVNSAVQSGAYAAVSRSPQIDALLVFSINFKMIKDLIFLYGYRPTEPKLIRIALRVLFNSFAAYQINASQIGAVITGKFTAKSLPIVANGTAFLADAVIQAITNGTLTMWIGYKTLNYLMKEYKLQSLYEEIDILDDQKELSNTRKQIIDQITKEVPIMKSQIEKHIYNNDKENVVAKEGEIIMPYSYDTFIGLPFIEVQKSLLKLGFSIEKISLKSEIRKNKSFFKKDGEVVAITFNGNPNIEKGEKLKNDADIEIKYLAYL